MSMIVWRGGGATPPEIPSGAFQARALVMASDLSELVPHLNNVALLRLVDEVAVLHGNTAGVSRDVLLEQGRMWFVVRHELDYLAEAFRGDPIGLATWISHAGQTTAVRTTVLWRTNDLVVIGRAATTWVHLKLESRRPCRIPASDLAALRLPDGP